MRLFVSYARKDEGVVKTLVKDLRVAHEVYFDQDNHKGTRWWDRILDELRACDAMVFVLSGASWQSKPCLAELAYARALHRPVLPVRIDVRIYFSAVVGFAEIDTLEYATRDADSAFALSGALSKMEPRIPLPDPLPDPPAIPLSPITPFAEQLGAATLSLQEQKAIVDGLKEYLEDEHYAEEAAFHLRERLLTREDVYYSIRTNTEKLLEAPANPPVLDVHPTVIALGEISAGETISPRRVEVRNRGGGRLDWVLATASDWLTLTPEDESFTIAAQPKAGRNDATVVVTDRASEDQAIVTVSATVHPPNPPVLDVRPTVIDLGEISAGDTISPRRVEVRNRGGGRLDWVLATASDWLTLTPEAESFTIAAQPKAGRNDATVVVTDRASEDQAIVTVSATVHPKWRWMLWLRERRALTAAIGAVVVLVVTVVLFAGRDDDDASADGDTGGQDNTEQPGGDDDTGVQVFDGIEVPATSDWTDTGIELAGGELVEISAYGEIGDNPEIPDQRFEPGGTFREDPDQHSGDPYLDFPHAALIGFIGDGAAFEVGYGTTIEDSPPGRLYLGINDGFFDDNSDKFFADITVKGQ